MCAYYILNMRLRYSKCRSSIQQPKSNEIRRRQRELQMTETPSPLTTAMFHVLLALSDRDNHGYAILESLASIDLDRFRGSFHELESTCCNFIAFSLLVRLTL